VPSATAAQTLAAVFQLPASGQTCLERAFAADRAATSPFAGNGPARDADLTELGKVARSCVPRATLAAAIVAGATDGTKPLGAVAQACVQHQVESLSSADEATVLAGLAVPNRLDDIQTALVGQIADRILRTCGISVPGSVPDVSETSTSLP
jgi:hypothetical protein